MKILRTIQEIEEYTKAVKASGRTIGLVPTMGALHEGHLTLMRLARQSCDVVLASVFVNPVQFGPGEDYDAYPRQFEDDCAQLATVPVDAVFHPDPVVMYPSGYATYINVESAITQKLCGAKRPGHFRGVATVVVKLMNLARADKAFFGQKDAQQVVVIHRFVADLNLPVEVVMAPISREASGLARSSRNVYLSASERTAALVLHRSLQAAQTAFSQGEKECLRLKQIVQTVLGSEPLADPDYVELYSFPELADISRVQGPALLAIAVRIGRTRLIDNIILEAEKPCC
jgi:pantoate--beta-alanine ligase